MIWILTNKQNQSDPSLIWTKWFRRNNYASYVGGSGVDVSSLRITSLTLFVTPRKRRQRWRRLRRKVGASACTVRHSSMVRHRVLIPGYGWHMMTWLDLYLLYPILSMYSSFDMDMFGDNSTRQNVLGRVGLMCICRSPMSGIPSGNQMWQSELLIATIFSILFRHILWFHHIWGLKNGISAPCLIAEGWMVQRPSLRIDFSPQMCAAGLKKCSWNLVVKVWVANVCADSMGWMGFQHVSTRKEVFGNHGSGTQEWRVYIYRSL